MLTTDLKLSGHSALPRIPILIAVEGSILRLTFYSDLRKYKSYVRHKSTRSRMEADFIHASNVNGNHESRSDLAGAPQPKRKAYKLGESRSTLIL